VVTMVYLGFFLSDAWAYKAALFPWLS